MTRVLHFSEITDLGVAVGVVLLQDFLLHKPDIAVYNPNVTPKFEDGTPNFGP